jgi:hypothetical protein
MIIKIKYFNRNKMDNDNYNYQDLMKLFAILLMFIDHCGLYLFPSSLLLRVIGRCSMPIFCFYAGYNIKDNNKKQSCVLFIYAIVLNLILNGLTFLEFNILFNILISQILITKIKQPKLLVILYFLSIPIWILINTYSSFYVEYRCLPLLFMISGYNLNNIMLLILSYVIGVFYTILTFGLSIKNNVIMIILQIMCCCLLSLNPKRKIRFKLLGLSRYSLQIYLIQFISFELYTYIND